MAEKHIIQNGIGQSSTVQTVLFVCNNLFNTKRKLKNIF